jgi:hypothetical protein
LAVSYRHKALRTSRFASPTRCPAPGFFMPNFWHAPRASPSLSASRAAACAQRWLVAVDQQSATSPHPRRRRERSSLIKAFSRRNSAALGLPRWQGASFNTMCRDVSARTHLTQSHAVSSAGTAAQQTEAVPFPSNEKCRQVQRHPTRGPSHQRK